MHNKDDIAAYDGKILGIRNYDTDKTEFYWSDFLDVPVFVDFIMQVSTGESDITPAGAVFIESFINLRKVANEAVIYGMTLPPYDDFSDRPASVDEAINRFVRYVELIPPMETALFIASKPDDRNGGLTRPSLKDLREEFLPPS